MNVNDPHHRARFPIAGMRLYWVGFTTFMIRAYRDIVTNFLLTIVPPAITTALYLLVFGTLIGGQAGSIDGVSFQQYLVPGLVLLPLVTASYGQAGLSFVVAKLNRTLDEHLVSPQPTWMILISYVASGVMRGIIAGTAAGFAALLLTHFPVQHVWMAAGTILLVALISSTAGFINGVLANTLDRVNWLLSFVLTPLTYLGGVFYSITLLPSWAQKLSFFDPIFYMLNLFRYCLLGVSDVHSVLAAAMMLMSAVSLLVVAGCLIEQGIRIHE